MKKIVIIGGGFTGSYCARKLQNKFDVTLIDTKDYFEFTPSILRTIIEPQHAKKIQIPHKKYLKKGSFIKDSVIEITKDKVMTKTRSFDFDYLIIASGSNYNHPIKEENVVLATRASHLIEAHKKLEHAKTILIIGGGLVGVELAAEIITKYPEKKITIVNGGDNLISRNHPKSIRYAERLLKKKGVNIIPKQRVISKDKSNYLTDKGERLKGDMVFICTGIKSNYEFMEKNFSKFLNERKQAKTNKYLQFDDMKNVFAGGDITDIIEEKTAQSAEKQARIIVKNVKRMENNLSLKEYIPKKRPMVISLGKYRGIFDTGTFVSNGPIPAIIKYFIEKKTMVGYR